MKNYKNDPIGRYLSDECVEYIQRLNEEKFNGKQFGRVLTAIIYDHELSSSNRNKKSTSRVLFFCLLLIRFFDLIKSNHSWLFLAMN